MDINQFIRVAESNGLEAINLIKNSKATQTATPTRTATGSLDIRPLYTSMAQPQPAAPLVTPKIDLYPKQLYPTQLYTPMKAGVSIQISEPTLKQIGIAYPAKLTSDTKQFELPDISKFPKISEMVFGEPAAMFNRWANKLPQTFIDNENKALNDFKIDLQNKLNTEVQSGQGDTFQANKLRKDISNIDSAVNSDSFFYKNQIRRDISDSYVTGSSVAGNVQTASNLWSVAKSVYDQFALSDEDRKKIQNENDVIQDPVTKFFDNVLEDLRPSKELQGTTPALIESIGGMAGLMYASAFAKSPWAATLIGSAVESLAEGGATYQENRKNGMSVEEAMNRQLGVIGLNLVFNYAFNRLTGVFEGLSENQVKSLFKKGVGLLGVGTGEGSQEAVQQIISNLATNRPIDEGVLESFGFGFVIGSGVQSVKLIHGPTGKVLLEQPIIPQVGRQIAENELALINGVAGTNVNINSSMDEITKAYYQAVSTAANMENASGLYSRLDGAYQLINSYKNALGQVSYKNDIDPNGELNNREFAIKATEKNLKLKEEARGIEKNPIKKYLNDIKQNYSSWINNVETFGKALQDIDRQREKRLGRSLKPGESVDLPFDELVQITTIVKNSPERAELTSIANDLNKNRLSQDEFGQYLESKRNIGLYEAGAKIDVNVQDELRIVAGFAPLYEKYAQRYYKVMNNIAKMVWDAGLITTEEYINITKNNDYAPFYVIFSENNKPVVPELQKTKKVGLGKQTVIRKFESKVSQQVENPFLIADVYLTHAYKQVKRNEAGLAIINAIESGDLQGAGFKGYIVQTAEDGRARQLVRDLKPQIEKIVNKVTNTLRKQKKSARLLQKEVNDMVRKSFKIISMSDTAQVDTVTQNRLTRKVETQLNKREELMQDAEDIFQGILEVKQTGEQVLNDKKYLDKTNRMFETRNEWVQDLVDLGADMLGKRKKSQMRDKNGKLMSLKDRRNFIKSASQRDIFNYILDLYDLPLPEFKRLLGKAITKNLKIKSVLQEIENIKNDRVTNIVVNNLIKLPSAEVDALYQKYGKTQKAIGRVIRELKRLTDARITNAAVNSLIKNTPEELTKIKKQLEKRYPLVEQVIQDILDTQAKLDEESGYLKKLNDIEEEIQTANTAGLETVEAYKDGYVIKAVVDKQIAETLYQINTPEQIKGILKFLNYATQLVKIGAVVVDLSAIPRLFVYDQQAAMMFGSKAVQKSLLNPINLGEALITTLTSGPFASKIYNVLPSGLQSGINKWREWQRTGGATSEYDIGTKKTSEEWLRSGGKNKISFGSVIEFFGKLDLITKFQIFNAAKQDYLNQGFTEEEATRKAGYDSRNTLPNFNRRSQILRMLDILRPFTGSAVQSAAKFRNYFANNPQEAVDRTVLVSLLPTALFILWNVSDEERRKAYYALQEWQKKNKFTLIFDEKDSNGNNYYTQIPMDQNSYSLLTGVRKVIEGAASTGSKDLLSGLSSLFESIYGIKIPLTGLVGDFKEANQELSSLNPIVVLPYELASNYDYFRNRKIVPDGISSRYPYQQVDDKTSEFAKFLGRRINFNPQENQYGTSPMKIDHALNKFGALGDYVRTAFEKIQGGEGTAEDKKIVNQYEGTLKGLFVDNRYGSAEQKIYEEKAAADMKQAGISFDITEALNRGDFETAKNLANNNVTKQQWAAIENNYQEKQIANTLSPKEKAYFNMPKSYLESIKSSKPEDAAVIDKVLELKKTTTKLPNMDTSGITFKPGTGGGSARLSVKQVKLGKVTKPKKIKVKAPAKPKNIKVAKPKQVKQPKLVKIKPLKKFKRI